MHPPERTGRPPAALILVVAALAGSATMVVELAAVRLLAPWFGTSQTVWTNVIGVVLFALALGYLLGARLSSRTRPELALGVLLLIGGATAAWLPALTPLVAETFLPPGLALDEVAGLLRWGSLAAALVLFLPSALLLGTIAPLCVEILARAAHTGAGSAGGRVLCVSTLGSLAGTFATSFVLVPELGLSRTFLSAGAVLAVLGTATLLSARSPKAVALLVLVAGAATAGELRRPALRAGASLLETRESPYQSVRVVEYRDDAGRPTRRELQVNEAFDSFQSVWVPAVGPIGGGEYYDVFALPAWWSGAPRTWRVGVLGLGGGTTLRVLDGGLPADTRLTALGIELDPTVVELGRRWMDLESSAVHRVLAGWDARAALVHAHEEFDELVLDAYSNQMEIPAHLCTREFFALARDRLALGGFLCVNVGAFALDDPVLDAVARSAASGMSEPVLALRVPFSRNVVLVARRGAGIPNPADPAFVPADERVAPLARRLALPGAWRWFEAGGAAPLVDDRCDIERLQLRSIERAREFGGGIP